MAEIVNSLFGIDPESIRQARDTAIQERALQYAKMDPFQRATAGLYSGASRLGDSIGGLLGGVDPQLQKSSALKQLASQFDTTSPQGLQEYARALASSGYNQEALQVANAAQGFLGKQAATAKDTAAAARERQAAIPPDVLKAQREAALKQAIRGLGDDESPEALQTKKTLQDELDALTRVKGAAPTELANLFTEQAKLDPVKDKTKYDAYTAKIKKLTEPGKSIGQEIGEGVSKAFGLLGDVLKPALKEEGKGIGEFAAKDYNTLANAVAAAPASKRNVKILKENLDVAFTGAFADAKKGVSSALIGLGLPIGDDIRNAVSGTELINAMGTRYVFPLVKNFPGSLAAKELDRLEKTAPNTLQQPETIKRLVSLLEADIAENEFTYKRAKAYKTDKKSFIGFDQADQKVEFQQKYSQLQDLVSAVRAKKSQTSSEAAQINALRKELGL